MANVYNIRNIQGSFAERTFSMDMTLENGQNATLNCAPSGSGCVNYRLTKADDLVEGRNVQVTGNQLDHATAWVTRSA